MKCWEIIQLREQIGATATLSANQNDSSELHGAGKTQGDNIGAGNGNPVAAKEVTERPTPAFSARAGATAPSDASPTYRAWLEHEKAEPEPGPNRGEKLPEDDKQVPSGGLKIQ